MRKFLLVTVLLATVLLGANADVDPNFYIYICFGQSNMEGNAQPEAVDKTGIDKRFRLLATCKFDSPSRTAGNWYQATPPLVSPAGGLGPTDYFGRTMCQYLPKEVRIGVIPVAMGGSPIEMFDKDKYQQKMQQNPNEWWAILAKNHYGGNPYGRIIEMAKKAQQVGVIKGILLHQGCSNNGDPNWPNMVKKIYNDMLKDLGLGTDSVPLFVGETLRQDQGGACWGHNTQVARMPSVVPNSYVISSEGCPGNGKDPWHFNAAGYRTIGKRYAKAALMPMGKYPLFSLLSDDITVAPGGTYEESNHTFTATKALLMGWTYTNPVDMSGSKYLVVKLKEPQTANGEVRLMKKNLIGYKEAIGDKTTIVIDLHDMTYNNTVMDPSAVYKVLFRANQAGTIAVEDVFLSNDDQYASMVTSVRDVDRSGVTDGSASDGAVFDMQGRRVGSQFSTPDSPLRKGLYIRNGKKVIVE